MVVEQNLAASEEEKSMRHIDEFTIHRFRGLRDVKLEGLGQINLLIGDNNAGKTSVLEAFSLFCNSLNRSRWLNVASTREPTLSSLSQDERLIWLFPQEENEQDPKLSLSALGDFLVKEVSASYEQLSENIQVKQQKYVEGELNFEDREREVKSVRIHVSTLSRQAAQNKSGVIEASEVTFVFPETRPRPIVKSPEGTVLSSQLVNPSSHRLSNIPPLLWTDVVYTETKDDVIALLHLFDSHIQDVDIVLSPVERPTVSVKHEKLRRAPLSTFGDGLRRVFTLAAAIPGARNGLLLVDELEMAIHTRVLEKSLAWLVKACLQNNIQLCATTHSLETVDAVLDACGKEIDLVTYRLLKREDKIDVTRFNRYALAGLRESLGAEVR